MTASHMDERRGSFTRLCVCVGIALFASASACSTGALSGLVSPFPRASPYRPFIDTWKGALPIVAVTGLPYIVGSVLLLIACRLALNHRKPMLDPSETRFGKAAGALMGVGSLAWLSILGGVLVGLLSARAAADFYVVMSGLVAAFLPFILIIGFAWRLVHGPAKKA